MKEVQFYNVTNDSYQALKELFFNHRKKFLNTEDFNKEWFVGLAESYEVLIKKYNDILDNNLAVQDTFIAFGENKKVINDLYDLFTKQGFLFDNKSNHDLALYTFMYKII